MKSIAFFILIITAVSTMAQSTRTIPISDGQYEAKVEIFVNNPDVKPDLQKTYAWFKSKKVHYTQGSFEGVLLHGKFVSFHSDEQLKEEGVYQTGLKNGLWKDWYANGKLKETTSWSNGVKQGLHTSYTEDGKIMSKSNFRNNEFHGSVITFDNGKEVSTKKYKNGVEVLDKEKVKNPKEKEAKEDDNTLKSGETKLFKAEDEKIEAPKRKKVKKQKNKKAKPENEKDKS
jgi:hypothetical protein